MLGFFSVGARVGAGHFVEFDVCQIWDLMRSWSTPTPADALELLAPEHTEPMVRTFAVQILKVSYAPNRPSTHVLVHLQLIICYPSSF